jgi:hypothetical protein
VKTTVEIPDALFRQAKAAASQQGLSLKDFFTDAVKQKLRSKGTASPNEPAWMTAFGGLRELRAENKRIKRIIEKEFETIDEEDWR